MYKKVFSLLLCGIILVITKVNAQKSVYVNQSTGTLGVSIPLFNVSSGVVSVPVSVSYSGTGVKVKDIEGTAGMNWQLNAGGRITRQVRGLPDDCSKNMSNQPRLGWIYNANGSAINSFSILNDNGVTCQDTTDIKYINSHFSGLTDTEPDVFFVNAPGLNCQLVFDNSHNIQIIPYQDLKVTYTTAADSSISSFTIVNDRGIKYTFSDVETTIRTTRTTGSSISYFKQDYDQYSGAIGGAVPDHGINYNSTWNLTQIIDANGNFITLSYNQGADDPAIEKGLYVYSVDVINLLEFDLGYYAWSPEYYIRTKMLPHYISSISYGHGIVSHSALSFTFGIGYSGMPLLTAITGYGKTIGFNYYGADKKYYLKSFSASSGECADPDSYQFTYNNLTVNTGPDSGTNPYTVGIPDSTTTQIDYWGYYNANGASSLIPKIYINPSNTSYERYRVDTAASVSSSYPYTLTGASRAANASTVLYGSLNKITYAGGGYTALTYEPNDFYDNTANVVTQGGGIRIKKITNYDGVSTANNVVKNYSYLNSAGISSGKPIAMPVFAFTSANDWAPSGGTVLNEWSSATVRSMDNLSPEDNTIVYTDVREKLYGAGSTLYHFIEPGTNWDASASPDWSPTITNIGRTSCIISDLMKNDKNTYPFPPNTNFDFERGLLSKVTSYTDDGHEVSEANYSYARTSTPTVITALKFDFAGSNISYAKYTMFANTSELDTMITKKVFNSDLTGSYTQSTENKYYSSTHHKLIQDKLTNSNGITQNSYTKYVKDFTVSLGSDSATNALYYLKKLNINAPVESYATVTQSGTSRYTGGSLRKFKTVNPTGSAFMFLPSQKLGFVSANGVSSFTPSAISGGTFSYDSQYIPVENDLAYDIAGSTITADDNNKHVQTILTDHITGLPVAAISNARYDEIGYNEQ